MGRGAWWATVNGVAKSQIQLHIHTYTHTHTHTHTIISHERIYWHNTRNYRFWDTQAFR